jgi:transposase-like protein
MVEAWHTSGETITAFAARHGVEARRLGRWVRRLGGEDEGVRFHPVRITGTSVHERPGPMIEIELAGGQRVRVAPGVHGDDLQRVLTVLARTAAC